MDNIIKSPIISLDVYDVKTARGNKVKVGGRGFYALTYRKEGVVKIDISGKQFVSSKNFITFTPKGTNYTTRVCEDTHIIAIHFDCLDENAYNIPFAFENTSPYTAQLFDLIYEKYLSGDRNNYECYSLFYKLLYEIERYFKLEENNNIPKAVADAKEIIEKSFTDKSFNIDSLVLCLPISASYLRREFKKAYSLTPIEYLNYMRLQKAISLLTSEYYTIYELAEKCGYSSASYFIQAFKKNTGYSPGEYKKNKTRNKNLTKF